MYSLSMIPMAISEVLFSGITTRSARVTPHDLRHTAASLAISAGANVKVIQRMLGHKSAKVTLDTYVALSPMTLTTSLTLSAGNG